MSILPCPLITPVSRILRARIPLAPHDPSQLQDITITDSHISDIQPHDPSKLTNPMTSGGTEENVVDANGALVTTSLCHVHVHLDKAFLFSDEMYADLMPKEGTFEEAMELGRRAKERFTREDLVRRGGWFIAESIAAGVTHMRVFVEVDHLVEHSCLEVAIALRVAFKHCCVIQICAFAQDPIFSGQFHDQNFKLFQAACQRPEVDVIGTTPYVEDSEHDATRNYKYAIDTAEQLHKPCDLHIDYNLDPATSAVTMSVLDYLKNRQSRTETPAKNTCLGHCTRLTLLGQQDWKHIASTIKDNDLSVSLLGLPTSDLYIQGRPTEIAGGGERPRGTLQIPQMIQKYGVNGIIAINNVGNTFTPQGSCDPLTLASWSIAVYQAGTAADTECLFECVSNRAREAIGFDGNREVRVGTKADLVIYSSGRNEDRLSRQRPRLRLQDLIYDPPQERRVIFNGCMIEL